MSKKKLLKDAQKRANRIIESKLSHFNSLSHNGNIFPVYSTQLRTCNACVTIWNYKTGELYGYVLTSYYSTIAVITNGVCYDFLRYAYGYTSTSAQHINKFAKDYNAIDILTWRDVN